MRFCASPTARSAITRPAAGWCVLLLALLLAETLTGLYVANDIADVGPLTEIVPAPVANAIAAAHAILWDVLLAADRVSRAGDRRLCGGEGTQPAAPDDHRDKGSAGKRSRAADRRATALAAVLLAGGAAAAAILANLM